MSTLQHDTTTQGETTADVLALTDQEWWQEYDRTAYFEDGRYHLSGIKESARIGSRDTHISLEQLKALHAATGRLIDGLDKPASAGPVLSTFIQYVPTNIADLATHAGVDVGALQRHLDGEGPLSALAYHRVMAAMAGTYAATA